MSPRKNDFSSEQVPPPDGFARIDDLPEAHTRR
jgi:hypothetical protein